MCTIYYVSKLARDKRCGSCQVGEGADELFLGYPTWKIKLNLQRYNSIPGLRWLKRLGMKVLELADKKDTLYYELLRRGEAKLPIFWEGLKHLLRNKKSGCYLHGCEKFLQTHFLGNNRTYLG